MDAQAAFDLVSPGRRCGRGSQFWAPKDCPERVNLFTFLFVLRHMGWFELVAWAGPGHSPCEPAKNPLALNSYVAEKKVRAIFPETCALPFFAEFPTRHGMFPICWRAFLGGVWAFGWPRRKHQGAENVSFSTRFGSVKGLTRTSSLRLSVC